MKPSRIVAFALVPLMIAMAIPLLPPVRAQNATPPRERVEFVLKRTGDVAPGRKVKAHLFSESGAAVMALSSEAGMVGFDKVAVGRCDLWIEPDGPVPGALFHGLVVESGAGAQQIPLTIPETGTVKGRLLLEEGKAPARDFVMAVQTGTVPDASTSREQRRAAYARGALSCYAETQVTADGSFVLAGLTPGRHALDVRRPREREAWSSVSCEVKPGQTTDLGTLTVAREGWQPLFDRTSLAGWVSSNFFGRSEVFVEHGHLVIQKGNNMTGLTWAPTGAVKELPRVDYELTLQAQRMVGRDFFCGLTFPVQKDPCTLILGGWGGTTVGLSSLDSADASMNETSQSIAFENQTWYRIRLRVTQKKIEVWLDEKSIIEVETEGRRIGVRIESEPSIPLGIATWRTTGAVRDLRIRKLAG